MLILNRKEKLDLIFNRIILKIYNSTDNLTEHTFPINRHIYRNQSFFNPKTII